MSETPISEATTHPAPTNGWPAHHVRIADLLDDVTVTASSDPVTNGGDGSALAAKLPAAPPAASPATNVTSLFTPLPERALSAPEISDPPAPLTEERSTALPGERLVGAPRRPASDLPPFLVQPAPTTPTPLIPPASLAPVAPPVEAVVPTPSPSDEDDNPQPADNQLVNIKGRSDGIAVEVGHGSWHEILGALTKRLEQSAGFFRHGSVALDVGPRPVVEDELRQFAAVLTQFEMKLGVVRTSSERAFQAALATGMTATLESPEGAPMAAAAPAATNTDAANYFVYRGYLRSGHRLRRKENILVIGDINPGAEVISEGDILVWGRLRGVVHAGAGGNRRAIVAALDLEPTQMRIADVTTIGPDPKPGQPGRFFWKKSQHKRPEIARLVQNEIVLEEWDAARPGGLVSLRRGAG